MQLKLNSSRGLGQSLAKQIIKIIFIVLLLILGIFIIDKFNFPSPENDIKKDITNETIKLK
tara:strand:- start:401 stop:583 length:183 start_codon:yes stop_codon:yes gene_type:complete